MSLQLRLDNVQHRLGQHLTMPYLKRLLDHIDESEHTRHILEATVMVLGYGICSDRTLHIVFNKKRTISRIKTGKKCRLNATNIRKVKRWMAYRPGTFNLECGFKGDKLLHALRDWCLFMVSNQKPIPKRIATTTHETQVTPMQNQVKSVNDPMINKEIASTSTIKDNNRNNSIKQNIKVIPKASEPIEPTVNEIECKTVESTKTTSKTTSKTIPPKSPNKPILNSMKAENAKILPKVHVNKDLESPNTVATTILNSILNTPTTSIKAEPKTDKIALNKPRRAPKMKRTPPKKNKIRKSKRNKRKHIGINSIINMCDKSVGSNISELRKQQSNNKIQQVAVGKTGNLTHSVSTLNEKIDDSFAMLLDTAKSLKDAQNDIKYIQKKSNTKQVNKSQQQLDEDDELDWKRQRESLLKKIKIDQENLIFALKQNQQTF